jgi:hypothetical protein
MPIDLTGTVQDPLAVQAILAHRAPAPPGPAPPAPVEVVTYRYLCEPASRRASSSG